jgi:hypothetical protein
MHKRAFLCKDYFRRIIMANCTFGPIVDAVRGSIGGTTFSRGCSGPTIRSRPRPANPNAPRQITSKANLSFIVGKWATVSVATRALWTAYAATFSLTDSLGRSYQLTGFQAFMRNSSILYAGALGYTSDLCPDAAGLASAPILTFDYNAHNLRLTAISPSLVASNSLLMRIHYPSKRLTFPRSPILTTVTASFGISLPYTVVATIDANSSIGDIVRVFIDWHFLDANFRITTQQQSYLDFTVA